LFFENGDAKIGRNAIEVKKSRDKKAYYAAHIYLGSSQKAERTGILFVLTIFSE